MKLKIPTRKPEEKILPPDWRSQVLIRQLTEADLPDLEWEGRFKHFRRLNAQALKRAQEGRAVLWAADLPEFGLIGQVFVQHTASRPEVADGVTRAYIHAVRVREACQNAGIGALMMQTAEADLFQRGFRFVTLNVEQDNPAAQRFYERLGYQVVAPEPGRWSYYDHLGRKRKVHEPSWRMEKELKE